VTFNYQNYKIVVWERSPNLEQNISPPPRHFLRKARIGYLLLCALFWWSWSWRAHQWWQPSYPIEQTCYHPMSQTGAKTCRCTGSIMREKLNIFLSNQITRDTLNYDFYPLANQMRSSNHQVLEQTGSLVPALVRSYQVNGKAAHWNNLPRLTTWWVIHDLNGTVTRWFLSILWTHYPLIHY